MGLLHRDAHLFADRLLGTSAGRGIERDRQRIAAGCVGDDAGRALVGERLILLDGDVGLAAAAGRGRAAKKADLHRAGVGGFGAGAVVVEIDVREDLFGWGAGGQRAIAGRRRLTGELAVGIVAVAVHDDPRDERRARRHIGWPGYALSTR